MIFFFLIFEPSPRSWPESGRLCVFYMLFERPSYSNYPLPVCTDCIEMFKGVSSVRSLPPLPKQPSRWLIISTNVWWSHSNLWRCSTQALGVGVPVRSLLFRNGWCACIDVGRQRENQWWETLTVLVKSTVSNLNCLSAFPFPSDLNGNYR